MKSLFLGVVFIIVIGVGGLVYRNAVEHPNRPIACPVDAKICPDGTAVARTGLSCTFPACPPPNVTLSELGITFAVPPGFVAVSIPDASDIVAYEIPAKGAAVSPATIVVHRYVIDPSATALETIKKTAIGATSEMPVPTTAFSSTELGQYRFTVVNIERFEGVINTAYYLARNNDVLRFDAIDRNVANWTDPNLDVSVLSADAALRKMLSTMSGV
jgi:hypothetical protein